MSCTARRTPGSVAIKFLPEATAQDADTLQRSAREARAASALNHPHICTIHDIGEHAVRPFLVMELLEGRTLEERIAEGPLPAAKALAIAAQIADALEPAHAAGIVHRDVKSSCAETRSRRARAQGRTRAGLRPARGHLTAG